MLPAMGDESATRLLDEVAGSGGLDGLRRLTAMIAAMESRRTSIIHGLREARAASWEEIGRACGMTRQGATRRWSKQLHAASFDGAADAYQQGRPGYPRSVAEWAVPRGARRVLDLAAGTGKFTRLLADAKLAVVAVEPSAKMREQLSSAVPSADVRAGTAEHIPLDDGSVDAVVVAQAWHWMDASAALSEIARVLVPGGTLSLVWNVRDNTEPWVAMLDSILHRHSRQVIDTAPDVGAPFGELERMRICWRQPLTRDGLLAMVASRSYVIVLPEHERADLLAAVEELLCTHPDLAGRDELEMPYVTHCTRVRRR